MDPFVLVSKDVPVVALSEKLCWASNNVRKRNLSGLAFWLRSHFLAEARGH